MTTLPILWGAPESGHSYKVRLALLLAGMPHAWRTIDLAQPRGQRDPAFERVTRFGEVPVWVEGETVLAQSNAILLHLAARHGVLPGPPAALGEWLFWESNRIGLAVPHLRFARRWAPQPEAVLDWLRARARADLAVLEAVLTRQDYLLASGLSVADCSCAGYLYWLDQAGLDGREWPAIQAWLARLAERPGWMAPDAALAAR